MGLVVDERGMKEFEIQPPVEGANTLFAQFSVVKLDEVVRAVRAAADVPEDMPAYFEENYPEMSDALVEKICLLAVGETPADDFDDAQISHVEEPDANTVHLCLRESPEKWESGDLVYFRGKRWIVGTRQDCQLVLKHF